nr:hypothetical protein [Rhizobium jaguaris]
MYDDYAAYPKRATSFGKPLAWFVALFAFWCLLLLLFNRFPQIDLSVARSVFTNAPCTSTDSAGEVCGKFAYDKYRLFVLLRTITLALPYVAIVVLLAVPFLSWRKLGGSHWRTPKIDQCIVALLSLAVGCGLIVNMILKAYSGRPRPRDTNLLAERWILLRRARLRENASGIVPSFLERRHQPDGFSVSSCCCRRAGVFLWECH